MEKRTLIYNVIAISMGSVISMRKGLVRMAFMRIVNDTGFFS